jgi:hypothetical protein
MPEAAWIKTVNEEDAREDLAAVYAECADPTTDRVAHIMKVHCLNPQRWCLMSLSKERSVTSRQS